MTPGTLIGKQYRLTRQLGAGAMGVVWAAINEKTSREVALKLILRSTEELRHRLMREARACGALQHRNIVDIYDVGQTDEGDPFLVMQLLLGETLGDRLARQRRLDPPDAASIGRDVARALEAAHGAGIIHRDLKPANIFLHREAGSDGVVIKVLDFGVSKNLSAADGLTTVAGGMVGSPAYMSPEQARGERSVDHRADLWSMGVVLFEMLTGVRPFQGDSTQIMVKIATGEVPLASRYVRRIDDGLVQLVGRCLERDVNRRIATAKLLAEQLDRFAVPTTKATPSPEAPGLAPRVEPPSGPVPALTAGPRPAIDPSTRSPRLPAMQIAPPMPGSDPDESDAATARLEPRNLASLARQAPTFGAPPPRDAAPSSAHGVALAPGTIPLAPQNDPGAARVPPSALGALPPTAQPLGGAIPAAPTFGAPPSVPLPGKTTERLGPPGAPWSPPQDSPVAALAPDGPRPVMPSKYEVADPDVQVTRQGTVRINPELVRHLPPVPTRRVGPPPTPPSPAGHVAGDRSPASSLSSSTAPSPARPPGLSDDEPLAIQARRTGLHVVIGISVVALVVLGIGLFLLLGGADAPLAAASSAAPSAPPVVAASSAPPPDAPPAAASSASAPASGAPSAGAPRPAPPRLPPSKPAAGPRPRKFDPSRP